MGIIAEVVKRSRLTRPVRTVICHLNVQRRPILLVVAVVARNEVLARVYDPIVVKERVKDGNWDVLILTRVRDRV